MVRVDPFQVLELPQSFLLLQVAVAQADQVPEVLREHHQRAQQARPVSTSQGSVVRQALVAFLAEPEALQALAAFQAGQGVLQALVASQALRACLAELEVHQPLAA